MKINKKKEGINIHNFKDPRNEVKYQEKYKKDWRRKKKVKILVKAGKILQRHVHK